MLYVRDLYKSYWDGDRKVEVLRGVNLDVRKGEFIGIFGPSGSGKTTLLHIILGIETPDAGEVVFKGGDISIVFQDPMLLKDLTILENVMLPLMIKGSGLERAKEKALELLEWLGMRDMSHRLPYQLSGGERQRVAIARAVGVDPEVLLLDEPTGNLHMEMEREVMRIIWSLKGKGVSVIMVTHNLSLLEGFDRVFKLEEGVLKKT